jgi:hypothetical protein
MSCSNRDSSSTTLSLSPAFTLFEQTICLKTGRTSSQTAEDSTSHGEGGGLRHILQDQIHSQWSNYSGKMSSEKWVPSAAGAVFMSRIDARLQANCLSAVICHHRLSHPEVHRYYGAQLSVSRPMASCDNVTAPQNSFRHSASPPH